MVRLLRESERTDIDYAAELADGADVALVGIGEVDMTSGAFVEINGLLKVGHAAHPRCYAHNS
jgi:hypothetical protein